MTSAYRAVVALTVNDIMAECTYVTGVIGASLLLLEEREPSGRDARTQYRVVHHHLYVTNGIVKAGVDVVTKVMVYHVDRRLQWDVHAPAVWFCKHQIIETHTLQSRIRYSDRI